ncbi:MAG: heavy metal-binding domain-containing protein [Acidimicrobiia bacterium]
MADEPLVPEFTLPDWGTEGAPPEPTVPDDADDAAGSEVAVDGEPIEISVERPVLVTSGDLPPKWIVDTVHGLVTGHAKSDKDDPAEAAEAASVKAVAAVTERAAELGANAVTNLTLSVSGRKSKVVVTAWGTAVSFSR